ncbi:MAG TPA: MFS transporter, partial [Ktedonobacteraceae bacterium]|nr:MFS transporter [Ktedonobacteraceae bacterium]
TITWIGTGYFLANAAIIPIVGYISDRVGAKTIFLIALGVFTLGSALYAFAPNPHALFASGALATDPRSLERGKSAPLAAGCHGWREDRCGVRFPPVAQMLVVLNTEVLSLMDAHQVANIALGKSGASPLTPTRHLLGCFDLGCDF